MLRYIILVTTCAAMSWLHLSDIHVDMKYATNSPSKCIIWSKLGSMCCRAGDIPLSGSHPCSPYGDLSNDIPPLLVTSIMGWVKDNLEFDFIIDTGDDASHKDVDQVFTNDNADSIHFITDTLDTYFPTKPVYRVMGNHDAWWNVDQTFPGYDKFLKDITAPWKKWVTDQNMSSYGYYSQDLDNKTKIVVLNSLFYDTNNFFQVNTTKQDASRTGSQFNWLETELDTSKQVIFLNHIPLKSGESNSYMNAELTRLMQKKSIVATLNGHSHESRFILYTINGSYVSFALINPSLYTDGHYPMFRRYTYVDGVLNFDEYVCNMEKVIGNLTCTFEYNFLNEYGLTNIDLPNLINLFEKLKTNGTVLDTYISHYSPPKYDLSADYLGEILIEC